MIFFFFLLQTCCLEELEARNTTLNEVSMPILGRALKVGSQLQVLKLENCSLSGRPLIILGELFPMLKYRRVVVQFGKFYNN